MQEKTWDVVVAGGGMSGMCAALAAAEENVDVLLMEKSDEVGGNADIAVGLFWSFRDYDKFRAYIPGGDPALQYTLANNLQSAVYWLEEHGLPFDDPETVAEDGWGRCMNAGETGRRQPFTRKLAGRLSDFGVRVETRLALKDLELKEDENLVIVKAERDGQPATIRTRALVIATGGFSANRELLVKYIGEHARNLWMRTKKGPTGDGLQAVLRAGADISGDMTTFYGHTMPSATDNIPMEEYQPITPYFAKYAVLVNLEGRRFCDESKGRLEELNPQEGMRQPGGVYFLVFDSHIYREYSINQKVAKSIPQVDRVKRAAELGTPVVIADTLTELAEKLKGQGVDGDRFLREIEAYNRACREDGDIDPPRITHRFPLAEPPFYAMKCVPAITGTYGGLRVDTKFRVLDREGKPLAGLFACGMDAGGVFKDYYGGGLAWCAVSGRTAGKSAAASLRGRVVT